MNDRYFFLNISLTNKRSAKQNSSKLCLKNEGIITSLKVNTKSKTKTEVGTFDENSVYSNFSTKRH